MSAQDGTVLSANQDLARLVEENIDLIPNFPTDGVLFRDITPLLANGPAFEALTSGMADLYAGKIDYVVGLESRGFILAAPMATHLGIGLLTARKKGKLPGPVISIDYTLEYGTASLEIRPETVPAGARVLIVDDVLATGGTASAAVELLRQCGAEVVGLLVLLELTELEGRKKLENIPIDTIVAVDESY
ncbi:MAG: adenine phosphoribosyltransferase [Scrofimicrobium sp.]